MYSYVLCPQNPEMTNRHLHDANHNQFLDMTSDGSILGLPTQPMLTKPSEYNLQSQPQSQQHLQPSFSGAPQSNMPLSFPSMTPVEEPVLPTASYEFTPVFSGVPSVTPQNEFAVPPNQSFVAAPTSFSSGFLTDQQPGPLDRYPRAQELECYEQSQDLRLMMYGFGQNENPALAHDHEVQHFNVHHPLPPNPVIQQSVPLAAPFLPVSPSPLASGEMHPLGSAEVKTEPRSPGHSDPHKPGSLEILDQSKTFRPLKRPSSSRARRSRENSKSSRDARSREGSKSSRDSRGTLLSLDSLGSRSSTTSLDANSPPAFNPVSHKPYNRDHCRIVRGAAAGGASVKPPEALSKDIRYLQVNLILCGQSLEEVCNTPWTRAEIEDKRRIVRIERRQRGPHIFADFSIVGSAKEHPKTEPAPDNADVIEFSCLAWEKTSDDEEDGTHYYITSVEVVAIVETLIQSSLMESKLRRRERGRIRSNLSTFWQKPSFHSKTKGASDSHKAEFARSIMAYEIRKPRRFDKGFRILRFDRLALALKKALYCYYAEMSKDQKIRFTSTDYDF